MRMVQIQNTDRAVTSPDGNHGEHAKFDIFCGNLQKVAILLSEQQDLELRKIVKELGHEQLSPSESSTSSTQHRGIQLAFFCIGLVTFIFDPDLESPEGTLQMKLPVMHGQRTVKSET
jgi:hypothetical protein